jgi:uncharacterized protein YlxW (UPF0749 family)
MKCVCNSKIGVECTLGGVNEELELQAKDRIIRELEATVYSLYEENRMICSKARLREEIAIRRIQELEKKIRDSEKVEVDLRDQIEELNNKLQDTKNDQKQVKSTRCVKVMKLAGVTAAVGAMVVVCWFLLKIE